MSIIRRYHRGVRPDETAENVPGPTAVDLAGVATGSGGVIWSLPHGGDLDANLVQLGPNESIGEHVNSEVDVLMYVRGGAGTIAIDGAVYELGSDSVVLVPQHTSRAITASAAGISYLSIHRGRGPLTIGNASA